MFWFMVALVSSYKWIKLNNMPASSYDDIKAAVDALLKINSTVKRKKKAYVDKQKDLFTGIIMALQAVQTRTILTQTELKLDFSSYDEMFLQIIDSLILLHFGKEGYEVISFYLYEKWNPDGTVNELFDDDELEGAEEKIVNAFESVYLENTGDFEVKDGSVYLKGIGRTLPQLLVEEFLRIVNANNRNAYVLSMDEEYQSLKRFFMWCCLNPRAEVANELYRFLKENSFRITKQGFFVALRNVVTVHGSPELVHFVSNAYNKVRAVWKKSPADYSVYLKDGEYTFIRTEDSYIESTVTCEACDGEGESWDDYNEEWYTCEECDGRGEYTSNVVRDDLGDRKSTRLNSSHT